MTQRLWDIYSFTQKHIFSTYNVPDTVQIELSCLSKGHNPLEPEGLGSAPCFHLTELCNLIKTA